MRQARIAYEAYRKFSGRKSLMTGEELPPFEELPPPIKAAWQAAAFSLLQHVILELGRKE